MKLATQPSPSLVSSIGTLKHTSRRDGTRPKALTARSILLTTAGTSTAARPRAGMAYEGAASGDVGAGPATGESPRVDSRSGLEASLSDEAISCTSIQPSPRLYC